MGNEAPRWKASSASQSGSGVRGATQEVEAVAEGSTPPLKSSQQCLDPSSEIGAEVYGKRKISPGSSRASEGRRTTAKGRYNQRRHAPSATA